MTEEQKSKCHKIADHYGEEHQMLKAVEEMAELIQAIIKTVHGDTSHEWDYPGELADVMIMAEQLKYLYENCDSFSHDRIYRFIDAKLNRQIKRMEDKKMANVCDEYTQIETGECNCENCMTCDDKGINMTECMAMHGLCDPGYFDKE